MMKQLLYKIFKDRRIGGALKNTGQDDPILGVGWEDLIPLVTMKFGDLSWGDTKRRSASSSESYPLVTPRFIYIHKMV